MIYLIMLGLFEVFMKDFIYSFRIPLDLMMRFRNFPYSYRSCFKLARIFRVVLWKLVQEQNIPSMDLTSDHARVILKQWEHEYFIKETCYREN